MLLAAGANLNDTDVEGLTALHLACASANETASQVVALLIGKKAQVNTADTEGVTPLMRAADNADAALIKLLLSSGADKNAVDRQGRSAAMWCKQRDDEAGRLAAPLLE